MAVWLLLLNGCQPAAERGPQGAAETAGAAEGETEYFACYLQGDKTGYIESTSRRVRQDERDLIETTTNQRLAARRFGNEVQIDIATTSLETLAGEVLRCSATTTVGGNTDTIQARREGDQLILETTVAGTRSSSRMACERDVLGFQGIDRSLRRDPLQTGQSRSAKVLLPMLSTIVISEVQLTAAKRETVQLLDRSAELLRIDGRTTIPGQPPLVVESSLWVDAGGRDLKSTATAAPGIEETNYRTTRSGRAGRGR